MTCLSVLCTAVAISLTGLHDPVWATDSQLGQGVKDDAEAHYTLGNALREKGDLDGAISEYRQAVKSNPNFVNAYYSLGIVLAGKGDTAGAIQEYRNYIRLSTDEQWKWKAREMIRKLGGAP